MSGEIFVANRTALIKFEGREIMLRRGVTRVRAGHPLLKGRESLFDSVGVDFEWPVEQATAAPGEKRQVAPKARRGKAADS